MNVILLEPAEIDADGRAILVDDRAHHIRQVLRVAPGATIRVGVLDGPLGDATVVGVTDTAVDLACRLESHAPPRPRVDLLLAVPRPKVLRRLWAQLAALGVDRVVLTNAARVERPYFDSHVITEACYRPLLVEGLQQARDTRLPRVRVVRQFRKFVEDELEATFGPGRRVVAHPGAPQPIRSVLAGPSEDRVVLAIGPEGGWNAFELGLLAARGFVPVGLGPRPLRTDTATIALLTLVHEALA